MYISEQNLAVQDIFYQYAYNVDDPLKVPRGPFFTKQPSDIVIDDSRKSTTSSATMTYVYIIHFKMYSFLLFK